MKNAPFTQSEAIRLDSLREYEILDTLPEQAYDDLVFLASQMCGTPIALVSLVDHGRQWFKAKLGLEVTETPRDISFCGHAILQNELFIVEDTLADDRFLDNPLVTGPPGIRFYAGAPIKAASGENLGTICVIDIVPRTLSDAEKNCLGALSRQVKNNMELRLAARKAEAATRAKTLFLANMSHEVRTPMNAITSCTDLLIDSVKDAHQLELLKLMHDAGANLMTLINDILDFSKLESEAIELRETVFNLPSLAKDAVNILGPRAKENQCEIVLDIASTVPEWVLGDADRLRQILFNLIGNAVKFCSHTVSLSLSAEQSAGNEILACKVKDDGKGIAPEDKLHIFKRFAQARNSSAEVQTGAGLGLAICQSLCAAMKGEIWVESEPGAGSVFCFQIPLQAASARVASIEAQTLSSIAPDMGSKLPLRILIAEDSEVNQFLIRVMLDKLGYEVTVVSDGIEAVEACEQGNYDVILMDLKMPRMDGVEATLKIREAGFERPTIIALTANVFDEDKKAALASGMDGFLTKPINLEAIALALRGIERK